MVNAIVFVAEHGSKWRGLPNEWSEERGNRRALKATNPHADDEWRASIEKSEAVNESGVPERRVKTLLI